MRELLGPFLIQFDLDQSTLSQISMRECSELNLVESSQAELMMLMFLEADWCRHSLNHT